MKWFVKAITAFIVISCSLAVKVGAQSARPLAANKGSVIFRQ